MQKRLLHYYFKIRTWWPFWLYVLNFKARYLFKKESPLLTPVQKNIVSTLETKGIAISSLSELFPEENVLEKLEVFTQTLGHGISSQTKKKFLLEYWPLAPELDIGNPFLELALSETILNIVHTYMNMWSRLKHYHLAKTLPNFGSTAPTQSQRWHRDPEEKRMCKVFIYLSDVTEEAGPFMYIPHSTWGKQWGKLFPQKTPEGVYPEEGAVERRIKKENILTLTGKKGTVIFCDTTGLHRGGYATREIRLMSTFFYSSPTYSEGNRFTWPKNKQVFKKNLTKKERFVLKGKQIIVKI